MTDTTIKMFKYAPFVGVFVYAPVMLALIKLTGGEYWLFSTGVVAAVGSALYVTLFPKYLERRSDSE